MNIRSQATVAFCICAWMTIAAAGWAAEEPEAHKGATGAEAAQTEKKPPATQSGKTAEPPAPVGKSSITLHTAAIHGEELNYTATAGYLQTLDAAGKPRADIFYVAYVKDGTSEDHSARPITFAFNGGPGAASMWLNLGVLGPKRVQTADQGKALPDPVRLTDNEFTWLAFTDLVFLDPVGTGYSRPAPGVEAKSFYNVEGDVDSAANFIRLYVTRNKRWLSPKFLVGESYGGTRAAALSERLQDACGMNLRGIVLISSVLDFQTVSFEPGNDLPFALYLPCYTAIAWYHKKLPADLLRLTLPEALAEAEGWAMEKYLPALAKGAALTEEGRRAVAAELARYTGLPEPALLKADLRIANRRFAKDLLADQDRVLGLMDGRVAGYDTSPESPHVEYDPSFYIQTAPFVACMNEYLRSDLKYETDLSYEYLSAEVNRSWSWGESGQGFLNELRALRRAATENVQLRLFLANGLFDLNTSYFATKYAIAHLGLNAALRDHVLVRQYPAGHMMYADPECLKQLSEDAAGFYKERR